MAAQLSSSSYKGRSNDGVEYDDGIQSVILSSSDDDPPLVYSVQNPVVASSGDLGVLLLRWKDRMPSLHQSESEYALLNPATRQRREAQDTKVIQPVYVYELGLAGGWRKLTADYPFHPQGGAQFPTNLCRSTYFKGSIYWFSHPRSGEALSIVTFDLGTEVFRKIDCPIYARDDHRTIMGPYIYRDSIAVFASDISSVDIWLLSGELCWIKHSNIAPLPLELHFCASFTDDKLVALSPYEEDRKHDLVVFDTRKQQVKIVIPDLLLYELFTYRESLVCVQ
ncbi:hypothetical protein LINGRAHAP2_LOCUS21762 [Linum grandiflorum]